MTRIDRILEAEDLQALIDVELAVLDRRCLDEDDLDGPCRFNSETRAPWERRLWCRSCKQAGRVLP